MDLSNISSAEQHHKDMLQDAEHYRLVRRARGSQDVSVSRGTLQALIRNLMGMSVEDERIAAPQRNYRNLDLDSGVFPAV